MRENQSFVLGLSKRENERAESRLAWEQDEPPSEWMPAHDEQALHENLVAVFREMEDGNYLEPSDDDFEQALHRYAQSSSAE